MPAATVNRRGNAQALQAWDRTLAISLLLLLVLFGAGCFLQRPARFARSSWSGLLALSSALLMLTPLVYAFVKRVAPLRQTFATRYSFCGLQRAHMSLGVLGALLAFLHSGLHSHTALSKALVGSLMISIVSGCLGKYFRGYGAGRLRGARLQMQVRRRSGVWLMVHVSSSAAFYVLLAVHICAEVAFGLPWFG